MSIIYFFLVRKLKPVFMSELIDSSLIILSLKAYNSALARAKQHLDVYQIKIKQVISIQQPNLQMRKLSYNSLSDISKVTKLGKWQSQDSNPGNLAPQSTCSAITLCCLLLITPTLEAPVCVWLCSCDPFENTLWNTEDLSLNLKLTISRPVSLPIKGGLLFLHLIVIIRIRSNVSKLLCTRRH